MKCGTLLRLLERARVAQSRGEWPGVSWTLFRELGVSIREGARELRDGAAEEVGGPRFGSGPVEGTRKEEAVLGCVRTGGPLGGGMRPDEEGFGGCGGAMRPAGGLEEGGGGAMADTSFEGAVMENAGTGAGTDAR